MTGAPRAVALGLLGMTITVVCLALFGCAGPSRARYAELLHECREHQREYVRLDKANQARAARCKAVRVGDSPWFEGWMRAGVLICPPDQAEEQAFGGVGFGEGGQ